MSPSRRQQFVPSRRRSEVVVAVAVGVGIVGLTALLIWLMRPGPAGIPGKGGLFSRQPRITLLVILALLAVGVAVAFVLRRPRGRRLGTRPAAGLATGAVAVLAVVAGIFWPGGVIRHWPSFPSVPNVSVPPTSTPAPTARTGTTTRSPTTARNPAGSAPAATSAPSTAKGG